MGQLEFSFPIDISVLDLTNIDLATEEDKSYNIDKWASLFKAQTWEEIKMLAEKNESIDEAATTLYQLSADEKIRLQCEAREKYERDQRSVQHMLEKLQKENAEQKKEIVKLRAELASHINFSSNSSRETGFEK